MYISIGMPSRGRENAFILSEAAVAPKPKTFVLLSLKTLARVVKLTVIIMLCGLLQVSARTTAQTRISLNLKGATLEKVFAEIEKRSGYTVFYNVEVLKAAGANLLTLDVKDATIEDVMYKCLKGLPLQFTIQDKTIFVKKEAPRAELISPPVPGGPTPQTFSGIVKAESGAPLSGATVLIPKLKQSAVTDKEGQFSIKDVPDGEYEVEISFVGYEPRKMKVSVVNHEALLTAELKLSTSNLDETVVKGYYSTTNRLNTGDVTTVKGEEIDKQPVTDPILALEGRVPGLYVQQTSGVPGAYPTISIEGKNSIANGNNPLYIVDGVPYSSTTPTSTIIGGGVLGIPGGEFGNGVGASPFNDLNPADIENIVVLKDADATAIYGSRGANGVILITTKKGKAGGTQFNLNAFSGGGKVAHFLHYMNTPEYLAMRHEALNNDGLTPNPAVDFDLTDWDTTRFTNWQKVLIGNTAKFNNLEGSLSGGNTNTQFRINGGYSKQGTVYPGDYSDQKAMVSFNLTHISVNQRLHAQLTASYVYDYSNLPPADFTSSVNLAPDAPAIFDANGNLNWQLVNGTNSWNNPLANTLVNAYAKTNNLVSNLNVSYFILPGLQLKSNFGFTHLQNNQSLQSPGNAAPPPYNTMPSTRTNNFATTDFSSWIIEPQLNYDKNISNGKLDILIGSTFQQNLENANGFMTSGYASDALISDPQAASVQSFSGFSNTLYHYDAGFGRINYDWREKYLINITARRDGSSRFGPGKQFGNFGAIGAGWIFSRESFFQNRLSALSFGKLRVSYGSTGNDQITDYQYLSTYTPNSRTYQGLTGLRPTRLSDPYFAWELVKKLEGGIELGFLKDKILLTANYYRNRTGNQLVGFALPSQTGFNSIQANLPAIVQNSGGEFILHTINVRSHSLTWTSSINLTIPENKLISYPNLSTSTYANRFVIGKSLFSEKLFHVSGVNDTTGVYQFVTSKGLSDNPSYPQDFKVTKPITQHWYGGFENTIAYKNFDLDFLFQFVNQTGFNYLGSGYYVAGIFNINQPTAVLNRWQKLGDNAHYGLYSTQGAADPNYDLYGTSDWGLCNASFVRLKNLALSYHLPKKWLQKVQLANARLYVQCQNLFTITHNFLGFDAESDGASVSLPPLRIITGGLQITL
jgi:TonB-linked SusC/RagA family outer membrane protein